MTIAFKKHVNPREIKSYIDKKINPKLEPLGLTSATGYFLFHIGASEGISLKELSEEMYVDKSLCTRYAKWLIENGFVEDRTGEKHKFSLYLTEKGKNASETVTQYRNEIWKELMKYTTEEERETFMRVSDKIRKVIEEDKE